MCPLTGSTPARCQRPPGSSGRLRFLPGLPLAASNTVKVAENPSMAAMRPGLPGFAGGSATTLRSGGGGV